LPGNSRDDRDYLCTSGMTQPKTGVYSLISPNILDQFSQSYHHMKSLYMQTMDLYLTFQFVKGRCYGNQIILRKCYQRRLIFVALVLEDELQYYDLAVHINSGDDGATSSKNFGELLPSNSRDDGAYLWTSGTTRPKNWRILSNISGYTGSILTICSPYESALRADDGSVPYFPIYQGTLPWQPSNIAVMKANWYYVHSLHVCQMLARF